MSGSGGTGGSAAECATSSPHASCTCHAYGGHDYWFCTTKAVFDVAEGNCVSAGMHLMKVTSGPEDTWIYDTGFATLGEYWLGSSDESTPDTWTWLWGGTFWTGTANGTAGGYEHWNDNEPNASGECAMVQTGGAWDDRICTDQRGYVCEAVGD